MRAIFQFTVGLDVEDHEEAAQVARAMDQSAALNVLSVLEQHGVSLDETDGLDDWYGTNVLLPLGRSHESAAR